MDIVSKSWCVLIIDFLSLTRFTKKGYYFYFLIQLILNINKLMLMGRAYFDL